MLSTASSELDLILPGNERYDGARVAWNLAADLRPAAIVFPESAAEVMAAVDWARESGRLAHADARRAAGRGPRGHRRRGGALDPHDVIRSNHPIPPSAAAIANAA